MGNRGNKENRGTRDNRGNVKQGEQGEQGRAPWPAGLWGDGSGITVLAQSFLFLFRMDFKWSSAGKEGF